MRREDALALLVVVLGAVGVYRYLQLAQEHPEAGRGFGLLTILSIAVIAVFLAGVALMRRAGQR